MNALLNYNSNFLPSLGGSFNSYQNFLTPSFAGVPPVSSNALPQALANVPMQGFYGNVYGFPYPQVMQPNVNSAETTSEEKAPKVAEELSGEELEAARKSRKGDYKVTDAHQEVAGRYLEIAKGILDKEPAMVSEKEMTMMEKIFDKLEKNPMVAESFVKQSSDLTFSGHTSTLLGTYEQVLTKHEGRKEAKLKISEVKEKLAENVEGRNSKLWNEFDEASDADSNNVEYTTMDKVMNNPGKAAGYAIAGGAALFGTRYAVKKLFPQAFPAISKGVVRAGFLGLTAAAAYGVYKLCTSETK